MKLFGFLGGNREVSLNQNVEKEFRSVEERVQKWLAEESFEVKKASDQKSNFRYFGTKKGMPKFSVFQPYGKSDLVLVESGITFEGAEKEKLAALFTSHQDLLMELRLHLESNGFFYRIQPPDLNSGKAGGIVLAKPLYYDGMCKDRFLDTVLKITHTTVFIILTIHRYLAASSEKMMGPPSYLR
jgi:hypothetical protein